MNIQTVGIVGLGLLGRGITACLLAHGFRVRAFDSDSTRHTQAREHIEQALQELADHGLLAPNAGRVSYQATAAISEFAGCDFVIESVVENLAVKQSVFDELEAVVLADVPIASNTSALPITLLQQPRKHPERFVGMHWGEPAHVLRFLEVIRGKQTGDHAFETTVALGRALGKDPSLVLDDVPGFISNRLMYAVIREALHLLEGGVGDVETIDRSFRNDIGWWATIAGPFRWMDLTGLPAYLKVAEGLFPELSNATQVASVMRKLVESGADGVTNGKGFYDYTPQAGADWLKRWTEFTWDIRALADRYTPLDGV